MTDNDTDTDTDNDTANDNCIAHKGSVQFL